MDGETEIKEGLVVWSRSWNESPVTLRKELKGGELCSSAHLEHGGLSLRIKFSCAFTKRAIIVTISHDYYWCPSHLPLLICLAPSSTLNMASLLWGPAPVAAGIRDEALSCQIHRDLGSRPNPIQMSWLTTGEAECLSLKDAGVRTEVWIPASSQPDVYPWESHTRLPPWSPFLHY